MFYCFRTFINYSLEIHCSGVFLGLITDFINHILTVGRSQSLTTTSETATSITLDASDKDEDALTYAIKTFPAHRWAHLTKILGLLPILRVVLLDLIVSPLLPVSDGVSTSNAANVSISVNSLTPVNTPPIVTDKNVSTSRNTQLNITFRKLYWSQNCKIFSLTKLIY